MVKQVFLQLLLCLYASLMFFSILIGKFHTICMAVTMSHNLDVFRWFHCMMCRWLRQYQRGDGVLCYYSALGSDYGRQDVWGISQTSWSLVNPWVHLCREGQTCCLLPPPPSSWRPKTLTELPKGTSLCVSVFERGQVCLMKGLCLLYKLRNSPLPWAKLGKEKLS